MNAAAISYWLFTPCSRRIATRGLAALRNTRAVSSPGSKLTSTFNPWSLSSSMRSNSCFAVAGLSRSAWMVARSSSSTVCSSLRTVSFAFLVTSPTASAVMPLRSRTICTCGNLLLATCTTAPISSLKRRRSNSAPEPDSVSVTPRRLAKIISATVASSPPSLRS